MNRYIYNIIGCIFCLFVLSNCIGPTSSYNYREDYTDRPKPIPEGKPLLGKLYYPKGTLIHNDGTLYIPPETTITHGMVYLNEGCSWTDPYNKFNWAMHLTPPAAIYSG